MTNNSASTENLPVPSTTELSFDAVREIIAECLAVELDEVRPDARFFEDLGGESIELLELSFQFEKAFRIRAPFNDFKNKDLWERDEKSGEFTPAARGLMQRDFAYLDVERRLAESGTTNLRGLLTIEMIFLMLQHADTN